MFRRRITLNGTFFGAFSIFSRHSLGNPLVLFHQPTFLLSLESLFIFIFFVFLYLFRFSFILIPDIDFFFLDMRAPNTKPSTFAAAAGIDQGDEDIGGRIQSK